MANLVLPGIHHITALSGDAQDTLDFYVGVLGLRRVKTTVNFDDPTTHHLYYGDATGQPGTILTFFPWPRAASGAAGAGMVQSVAFAVPQPASDVLEYWRTRLREHGVEVETDKRFGNSLLRFTDSSGLQLELIASADAAAGTPWTEGPVPEAYAIRGFAPPTLPAFGDDRTVELFAEVFGWTEIGTEGPRMRFAGSEGEVGTAADLRVQDRHPSGRMGRGTVHHIAFRAPDAETQQAWQSALREQGLQVTDVKDRQYFSSIYFRDPDMTSGILFEIATDGPGFLHDETDENLGQSLRLPAHLESRREELESILPTLETPSVAPD